MSRKFFIHTTACLALATVVFAHHVAVPFSSVFGSEVLTDVTYYVGDGVPNYRLAEGHSFAVPSGASFHVSDGQGGTEEIVLSGGTMSALEVADAINTQSSIVSAAGEQNGHLVMHGLTGGDRSMVGLSEGALGGLAALGFQPGIGNGQDDVALTISLTDDTPAGLDHAGGLALHPYIVVASTTPGTTVLGEFDIPLLADKTTQLFLRATQLGLLPSFTGALSDTEDAQVKLTAAQLDLLFPQGEPDQLFLAFAVLSEDGSAVEFASNRFTVHFED